MTCFRILRGSYEDTSHSGLSNKWKTSFPSLLQGYPQPSTSPTLKQNYRRTSFVSGRRNRARTKKKSQTPLYFKLVVDRTTLQSESANISRAAPPSIDEGRQSEKTCCSFHHPHRPPHDIFLFPLESHSMPLHRTSYSQSKETVPLPLFARAN